MLLAPMHITYHDPIWDKLQSKNSDVEDELNIMRSHPSHVHSKYMFVGGDGLAQGEDTTKGTAVGRDGLTHGKRLEEGADS